MGAKSWITLYNVRFVFDSDWKIIKFVNKSGSQGTGYTSFTDQRNPSTAYQVPSGKKLIILGARRFEVGGTTTQMFLKQTNAANSSTGEVTKKSFCDYPTAGQCATSPWTDALMLEFDATRYITLHNPNSAQTIDIQEMIGLELPSESNPKFWINKFGRSFLFDISAMKLIYFDAFIGLSIGNGAGRTLEIGGTDYQVPSGKKLRIMAAQHLRNVGVAATGFAFVSSADGTSDQEHIVSGASLNAPSDPQPFIIPTTDGGTQKYPTLINASGGPRQFWAVGVCGLEYT